MIYMPAVASVISVMLVWARKEIRRDAERQAEIDQQEIAEFIEFFERIRKA